MSQKPTESNAPVPAESDGRNPSSVPDAPPPTMPAEARRGWPPPPPPPDAPMTRADGEPLSGGVPPGTAPEVPAAEGTSEDTAPTVGEHTPDVRPGGADFDTAAQPLPGRSDSAR